MKKITIKIILSLDTWQDFEIEQHDAKTSFLHRNLKEYI